MDYKKPENKEALLKFKDNVLNKINESLTKEIEIDQKLAALRTYWLRDQQNYYKQEKTFNPKYLPIYQRGSVIQINFGFNVGSEYGGLHYAIVLNKNDNKYNHVLTVMPLTSLNPGQDISKLSKNKVFLGDEIYRLVNTKINTLLDSCNYRIAKLENSKNDMPKNEFDKEVKLAKKETQHLSECLEKFLTMKNGSLGLFTNIVSISKMRITDPQRSDNPLSGIIVSQSTLDLISIEIAKHLDI